MKTKEIKIGSKVSIQRPDDSFSGQVTDTRSGWVRVYGKSSNEVFFDEWFPLVANKLKVTLQP